MTTMRMAGLRLSPILILIGLAVMVATIQLGNWQLRRADEKNALQARIDAALAAAPVAPADGVPPEWQRLMLRGRWLGEHSVFLDNRVHRGRVGYHVLTPLLPDGGGAAVLVNRGWVAAGPDRRALPQASAPAGEVRIEGLARRPEARPFTLAAHAADGLRWQFIDLAAYREASGLALAGYYLQQTGGEPADGLVREWPRPDAGIDRHRGYALQWFGLAALAGGLTLFHVLQGVRRAGA